MVHRAFGRFELCIEDIQQCAALLCQFSQSPPLPPSQILITGRANLYILYVIVHAPALPLRMHWTHKYPRPIDVNAKWDKTAIETNRTISRSKLRPNRWMIVEHRCLMFKSRRSVRAIPAISCGRKFPFDSIGKAKSNAFGWWSFCVEH